MIRYIAFICISLFATTGDAEIVTLRTGEHSGYTRVVLKIPIGSHWKVGRIESGYGLIISNATSFEIDGFFDRIDRRRIIDVLPGPTGRQLNLQIECECQANAFLFQPDMLVLDIRDGKATVESEFELALKVVPEQLNDQLPDFSRVAHTEQKPENPTTEITGPQIVAEKLLDPFAEVVAQQDTLLALESSIGDSISRATTQGLLTLANPSGSPIENTRTAIEIPIEETASIREELDVSANAPGIIIQTSIERDAPRSIHSTSVAQAGIECWDNRLVDIASWGGTEGFGNQIGPLWSTLTQEFDRTDPQAVESLSKAYLYFGFGREAQQVLQIDGLRSKERTVLITLAQIIDGDRVTPAIPAEMMGCEGDIALWAMLGQQVRDLTVAPNRNAILRGLKSLPKQLQTHLSTSVSAHFLEMGDADAAEQALAIGEWVSDKTVEHDLASIAIEAKRGEVEAARNQLNDLAMSNGRMTPEAVLDLIKLNLQNNIATSPDILVLSSAMRFESTGLPVSTELAVAEIESHVFARNFIAAKFLLEQERATIGELRFGMLFDKLVATATEHMLVQDFLDLSGMTTPDALSVDTANAVAARLLAVGLPEIAASYLLAPAIGENMAERRYLRAEAALQFGNFEEVDPILAGITSLRADGLRAAVLARQSGYDLPNNREISEEQVAWRQGNWSRLSSSEDQLLAEATALVLSDGDPNSIVRAPLENGYALLAETAEMRSVILELLNRYAAPDVAAEMTN